MIRAAQFCLMLALSVVTGIFLLAAVADAGCHARVQKVVAVQAYAAPYVQNQNIFYEVGGGIRFEAAVQKAVREELQQWKSLETGKPVVPPEPQPQQSSSLLNAKCAKCHEQFDGKQRITCEEYRKFDAFYMTVHNGLKSGITVPAKMQTVLGSLSEADFLNIKAEMHSLVDDQQPADEAGVLR